MLSMSLRIGMREIRSHNSWMHNSARLTPDNRRPTMLVNPDDARAVGIAADGQEVEILSATGKILMQVTLTEDVSAGTVAIPHGWGHTGAGGWRRANAAGESIPTRLFLSRTTTLSRSPRCPYSAAFLCSSGCHPAQRRMTPRATVVKAPRAAYTGPTSWRQSATAISSPRT
jgi:anaerobic selenocysteine-containing dehydrogenase